MCELFLYMVGENLIQSTQFKASINKILEKINYQLIVSLPYKLATFFTYRGFINISYATTKKI